MNIFSIIFKCIFHAIGRNIKRFAGFIGDIYGDPRDIPRDIMIFGGLFLMGYGLFLYRPWLSFTLSGFILLYLGLVYFRPRIKKEK